MTYQTFKLTFLQREGDRAHVTGVEVAPPLKAISSVVSQ